MSPNSSLNNIMVNPKYDFRVNPDRIQSNTEKPEWLSYF